MLRQQMPDLRREYGVRSLAVFASVAHGSAQKNSDLDLLVGFESEPPGLLQFLELEGYLGSLLDAKVHLVVETALKPRLKDRILAEAIAA